MHASTDSSELQLLIDQGKIDCQIIQTVKSRLSDAIDALKLAQADLSRLWQQELSYPCWIQSGIQKSDDMSQAEVIQGEEARRAVIQLLDTWEYQDHQTPGSTLQLPGLMGCSEKALALLNRVNQLRKALQEALQYSDRFWLSYRPNGRAMKDNITRLILIELNYARLNRRQICRQWVTVDFPLLSASFLWNHCRNTQRINPDDAERLLRKKTITSENKQAILEDLSRVALLDAENPTHDLIRVKTDTLTRRVNLQGKISGKEKTVLRYAHSPVLYLTQPYEPLPDIRPLPQHIHNKDDRLRHRDLMFEKDVYLKTLNAYRLKP